MLHSIDSIRSAGWEGFLTIDVLRRTKLAAVPEQQGVYLVLRPEPHAPIFLERSPAGHFKGKDPTVPVDKLKSNWIEGALVLYIGKAGKDGQEATLRSRLGQYLAFGAGSPSAHRGGRFIWQLAGTDSLLVCWKVLPNEDPREVERGLTAAFRKDHGGRRPFANLQD